MRPEVAKVAVRASSQAVAHRCWRSIWLMEREGFSLMLVDGSIQSPEPPSETSVCPSPARTRGGRAQRRARERPEATRSRAQADAGTAYAEHGEDGEDSTLPGASTAASLGCDGHHARDTRRSRRRWTSTRVTAM